LHILSIIKMVTSCFNNSKKILNFFENELSYILQDIGDSHLSLAIHALEDAKKSKDFLTKLNLNNEFINNLKMACEFFGMAIEKNQMKIDKISFYAEIDIEEYIMNLSNFFSRRKLETKFKKYLLCSLFIMLYYEIIEEEHIVKRYAQKAYTAYLYYNRLISKSDKNFYTKWLRETHELYNFLYYII